MLLLRNDPILPSCLDSRLTATSSSLCPAAVLCIHTGQRGNLNAENHPHTYFTFLGCLWGAFQDPAGFAVYEPFTVVTMGEGFQSGW